MNIDNLKSTIAKKGGLAPSNRFNVIFAPPAVSLLNLNVENIIGSVISGNFNAGIQSGGEGVVLVCLN